MFIAALRIMQMKKDCWIILLCFGIMVELGKERDASDKYRNAHQRGDEPVCRGRSFYIPYGLKVIWENQSYSHKKS